MKDLLLFVPVDDFALAQYEFIPTGVLSIASYLTPSVQTDILHKRVEDIPNNYAVYGVSATTNQYPIAREALHRIRKIAPQARVVLGGPHLNTESCVQECLKDDWDYLVVGEGERVLLEIIDRNVSTRVVQGKPIEDLDELHPLFFSKLNMQAYNFPLRRDLKCINVMTSRGCPYRCAFCSTAGTKLRQRSPENVILELQILKNQYGFDSFMFVDDTMSINRPRFREILKGVKELNIKWRSYGRVNVLNREDLELMAESGCLEVAIGVESGSQKILDLIRKGTNVQENIKFAHMCREIGIKCNAMLIVGLPGETRETIRKTQEWMEQARPEAFGYNIFFPFPDAPVRTDPAFEDLITIYDYDWDEAVTKAKSIDKCFVSTPTLTREDILNEYKRNFELFVSITGFDPRKRGTRK